MLLQLYLEHGGFGNKLLDEIKAACLTSTFGID